jgi:hypothetical protein
VGVTLKPIKLVKHLWSQLNFVLGWDTATTVIHLSVGRSGQVHMQWAPEASGEYTMIYHHLASQSNAECAISCTIGSRWRVNTASRFLISCRTAVILSGAGSFFPLPR